jgi:repressor LexA
MQDLTRAQQRVLDFVQAEVHAGRPNPTLREIANHFGFRSHRAAACHLEAIKRKGFLASDPGKARSLRVLSPWTKIRRRVADIPLFGSIPAGFAQNREQETEGCVSVDVESIGFKPTRNTFALRVTGDSMIDRHILDGDIVVLEHGPEPRHGEIVAALIDGEEATVKRFRREGDKVILESANPDYEPMVFTDGVEIVGKVVSVFRSYV